jgi:hypothetical protein
MRSSRGRRALAALALALLAALPAAAKQATPIASVQLGSGSIGFTPLVSFGSLTVTVTGPGDLALRKEFASGQSAVVSVSEGQAWADGQYRYELRAAPAIDPAAQDALRDARASGIEPLPPVSGEPLVQSGGFQVRGGAIVPASYTEGTLNPEFLVADDIYVQGGACIGIDCVDNESLGFDTIRLKENNLRIRFDDTSTTAGFPANDWQLTANDSASGGLNKFSIDDLTAVRTPFTIEAGATTNSVYVDSTGRVGFRTATPVLDLHVNTSNTPALRMEQNNSGGFTAQTWDVAGNEANFFVRDVTGGSTLPFRIFPGAPGNSVSVASGGVGIGHTAPSAPLHVRRTDGSTQVLIENTDGAVQTRRLLDLQNNGGVRMRLSDNSTGTTWAYQNIATEFLIDANGGGNEFLLSTAGNLTISGTLFQNSDRNVKTAVVPVDPRQVLDKVAALPISTWQYKADKETVRHLGPMAQDFAAAFGVGAGDRTLAPGDVAGVALAAIQALRQELTAARQEITELRARHGAQAARLAALEASLRDVRLQEVHQVLDGHRLVEHGDAHP